MKRGSELIVIDPRVTWLAAHAAWHIQLRPGTDAAVGLGMLNVIINEDLYDHEFVEKYSMDKILIYYPLDKIKEYYSEPEIWKIENYSFD